MNAVRTIPFVAGTLWCCAKSKPAAMPFRQYTVAGYDFWSPVAPSRYYPVNNDKLRQLPPGTAPPKCTLKMLHYKLWNNAAIVCALVRLCSRKAKTFHIKAHK